MITQVAAAREFRSSFYLMTRPIIVLLSLLFPMLLLAQEPQRESFLKKGERVVFLGDSITMDGLYIAVLDWLIRTRQPDSDISLMNLGLASETVSGLSEPHHPWPRPGVHERVQRVLEKAKPTTVFICYGMNDGIYAPFDEARFQAYQSAMTELVAKCKAAGARVVILTPPPFDAPSVTARMLPAGGGDYGYMSPFAEYDTVITRYGEWLLGTVGLADKVIDLHAPVAAALQSWRAGHPGWRSGDGVHCVASVHWLFAMLIAESIGLPAEVAALPKPVIDTEGAHTWTFSSPAPIPPPADETPGFLAAAGFSRAINRLRVTIPAPASAAWRLEENGKLLAVLTGDKLASGIDLTSLPGLTLNLDAARALPVALSRHALVSGAWREHCGHTRPQTDRNFPPLEQALHQAASMENEISSLQKPREIVIKLVPVLKIPAPEGSEFRGEGLSVRMVANVQAIQPGQPFQAGLYIRHAPGYHTYWSNPGLAGVPTSLRWDLPEGWTTGAIQWPSPARVKMAEVNTYGYEHDVLLIVAITPPATLPVSEVTLSAAAGWMCCARTCHPGQSPLSLTLPVTTAAEPIIDPAWAPVFTATATDIPAELSGWTFTATRNDKTVTLTGVPVPPLSTPEAPQFFSNDGFICSHHEQKWQTDGAGFTCTLPISDYAPAGVTTLTGLLCGKGKWNPSMTTTCARISIPLP